MLYFFRTPPGVKVGRAALDEDAIRLIEAHNPDIEFDWTRILKGQGQPAEERRQPPPGRERRQPPPPAPDTARGERVERREVERRDPVPEPSADVDAAPEADAVPVVLPELNGLVPGDVEGLVPSEVEGLAPSEVEGSEVEGPVTAAQEKLGSEGLSRLRGRYAEMLARITERITDPLRQDELKTLAERLNPDAWVTAEDVVAGLDSYEATFESLRGVVGHRRRRRRRRPQQQEPE